mmetsp:Transcript_15422/g.22001  ORF Transcript_15422/g.22001 Transcript_15422/m.22001 type:complete len:172 (-) Transcript_15422:886-1401(-)
MVYNHWPTKANPYRVGITIGGDRLVYISEMASPTLTLLETKLFLNSITSSASKGAKFATMDIKLFLLQTPLKEKEHIHLHCKYFLNRLITMHNLHHHINPYGYIYCQINKGIYSLKQVAFLAYKLLSTRLQQRVYKPIPHTHGLWRHKVCPTQFALCVDEFGVEYHSQVDL